MQENNLLNRNSTNDIQRVKFTYALVILISSIETENQLSYCGTTIIFTLLAIGEGFRSPPPPPAHLNVKRSLLSPNATR